MATKLTKSSDIKNNLVITKEFDGWLCCEYTLYGQPKVFKRTPIAMAELLKKFGFIDSYKVVEFPDEYGGNEIYVEYTPLDDEKQTESVEDFVDAMGTFHTLLFITAYEKQSFNRQEIAEETGKAKARVQTTQNY